MSKNKGKVNIIKRLLALGVVIVGVVAVKNVDLPSVKQQLGMETSKTAVPQSTEATDLAKLDYQSGSSAVIDVNNGTSTLDPNTWTENKVQYSDLDTLNRTSIQNTAYLEKKNATNVSLRERQYIKPTGWHSNGFNSKKQVYNRGHLIAYSISKGITQDGNYDPNEKSGDQNNPKNLFTQTAFSNQQLQTVYEKKVRDALYADKKVIYQAQAIFRGDELMARGVHLQAVSTDGSLNFNVYIYNVQPDYTFNYSNGSSSKDSSMTVPALSDSPSFNN